MGAVNAGSAVPGGVPGPMPPGGGSGGPPMAQPGPPQMMRNGLIRRGPGAGGMTPGMTQGAAPWSPQGGGGMNEGFGSGQPFTGGGGGGAEGGGSQPWYADQLKQDQTKQFDDTSVRQKQLAEQAALAEQIRQQKEELASNMPQQYDGGGNGD